ncbi:MAG: glycosyltransferase family 2 protein [Bacteroidaceae bacterium]|nr:glycosyltransferase family 2 protein [Bacteroidaceae bacterium]
MQKEFEYTNHLRDIDHVVSRLTVGKEGAISDPVVAVIMPVYNHPDFFRKSLISVLNQKCNFEYEIVILDNCHPDFQQRNQKIVEELYCTRIRYYINEENIGGVGSENRGAQLTNAEYITYCHDDDMLTENALQILIGYSQYITNSDSAIWGNLCVIDENDRPMKRYDEWKTIFLRRKNHYRVTMYDFLEKNYTNGCGSLYKRDKLLEIGGFNSDYIPCPDYALNVKYTSLYGSYAIRDITLRYRSSTQSDSSSAYIHIADAIKKIRDNILKGGYISRLFPRLFLKSNLICNEYHLYAKWSEKPKGLSFYFHRLNNRLWMLTLQVARSLR